MTPFRHRNRLVVAYTDRSKHAREINANNWTRIVRGKDVEIGRTDPNLAPQKISFGRSRSARASRCWPATAKNTPVHWRWR